MQSKRKLEAGITDHVEKEAIPYQGSSAYTSIDFIGLNRGACVSKHQTLVRVRAVGWGDLVMMGRRVWEGKGKSSLV